MLKAADVLPRIHLLDFRMLPASPGHPIFFRISARLKRDDLTPVNAGTALSYQ